MQALAEEPSRSGFCVARDLVPHEDLAELRAAIELALANQSRELVEAGELPAQEGSIAGGFLDGISFLLERNVVPRGARVVGNYLRKEIADAVDRLRGQPAITRFAKAILGPRIVSTPQFAVRAHCPGRFDLCFPWHQDVFFLDLEDQVRAHIVNFWIPLVPIDADAGGLDVIKESHLYGVLPHARVQQHRDAPYFMGVEPASLPPGEIVAPELHVGDALVMLDKTVHRTRMNRSPHVRWSVDIRYIEAGRPLGRSGAALAIP
jgi:hypothetical protein